MYNILVINYSKLPKSTILIDIGKMYILYNNLSDKYTTFDDLRRPYDQLN